jgi:hypothetical protein
MKRIHGFVGNLIGLLILATLAVGLIALLRNASFGTREPPVSPLYTPTPLALLQSPLATPTALPSVSATPAPTATPVVIPPPPNWPTNQPWPPQPTTPQPTLIPKPFATPAFRPIPQGPRPDKLQNIWYPYVPDPGGTPQLRAVEVDSQGRRWGQADRLLDLALPKPATEYDPGPILVDLHVSPNYRWLVADFAYVGSQLVDLSTGKIQPLISDSSINTWNFLAWTPDSQRILVSSYQGFLLVSLASHTYEVVDFPKAEYGPYVRAAAYSPDGKQLADALVYPAVYSVRDIEMTEIGLRNSESGERKIIIQIPGGMQVIDHSLRWSPDGHRLIWIVVVANRKSSSVGLANVQAQLWLADLTKNNVRAVKILGEAVEYVHQAVWSPDGRYIAIVKVEGVNEGKDVANNLYLLDLESEKERQLTHLTNQRLSHPNWSPNGQWLSFTVLMDDHSEIRLASLDGVQQYPIAGPAFPNAPFIWLP